MDELDVKIIEELQVDARVPFKKISERNGISIGTVHNRLKAMRANGTLLGFIPLLDDRGLGYQINAVTTVRVDGGYVDEVQASLASLPGLKFVWRMSGTADLVLVTRFKSMRDLTSFNATIQKIQHAKAETNIVVNTIKDIYAEVSRNAKQG